MCVCLQAVPVSSTAKMFALLANIAPRAGKIIVDEVTTLCRHIESKHSVSDLVTYSTFAN